MKINVGTIDRILRVSLGLGLIWFAYTGAIGIWGYIGVIPLLTGLFSFCPLYAALGIDTCPMRKR